MKILYVSQYYPPEIGAPAARVSELARAWAAAGHEVTVLTAFPHHPHGVKQPGDRWVLSRCETDPVEPRIQIVRTYVYAAANAGFFWRTVSYLSFMISAMTIGWLRVSRPDVLIATSPQLFTAVAGWWLSCLLRVPFLFEVRDLWPESIVTVGAMREGIAIRGLKRLARWLYHASQGIVTVGPGYRRRLLRDYQVPAAKVAVITNGVDLEHYQFQADARARLRQAHGWDGQTVVLYLGTHGMAHGLDVVLQAALQLTDSPIQFVFIGDGAEKKNLQAWATAQQQKNVTFLDAVDKQGVVQYYSAADLCLVPLRKVDLFTEVLPSKIFEIMAMRRPIVLSVDGDARQVVEQANAGIFVEPENIPSLVAAIRQLADDPALQLKLGANGRRCVERHYSRSALAQEYLQLLEQTIHSKMTAPTQLAVDTA